MAGFISKETIEQVYQATDIVSLVGEYTQLSPRGSDYWGCCPFHTEKTASFHVMPDKRFYYCFSCHAGGDAVKFVMEMEKLSYPDAIEYLAKKANIVVRYQDGYDNKPDPKLKLAEEYIELYERTSSMFHYLLLETPQGKAALEYITGRGLSLDTIKKFRLGYAPEDRRWLRKFLKGKNFTDPFLNESGLFSKDYPDISFFHNRLMFPIFNRRGQAVALGGRKLDEDPKSPKYLNSKELVQYHKGETLYAFNFAKKAVSEKRKVIFCEGYMDCIAYHQCGIEFAVAPLGTALTEEQIKIVRPFVDEVLLSFDSDAAGQKATLRAMLMIRKAGLSCRVIRLQGGKDPAEIMINFGINSLTNAIDNAILDSDFLLSRLGEEYPIDTPEGKMKAAYAFFPYIDSLTSDMHKESCLEQLCQAYNLKPEAVKRDFQNREKAHTSINTRQPDVIKKPARIKPTAELRSLLAVIADLNKYKLMHDELSSEDFEDPLARQLFTILENCYQENALLIPNILSSCDNEQLENLITSVISLGEYKDNTETAIKDSIRMIKRKSLEKRRDELMVRIRTFSPITAEDQMQFQKLVSEKMELDKQLRR